jgi:hypothetical protein
MLRDVPKVLGISGSNCVPQPVQLQGGSGSSTQPQIRQNRLSLAYGRRR